MNQPEVPAPGRPQLAPVGAQGLQELEGALDIVLEEGGRIVQGAVDMGLRRQMENHGRLEVAQQLQNSAAPADVELPETIGAGALEGGHRRRARRIAQAVDIEQIPGAGARQRAHQSPADKAGPPCYQRGLFVHLW